MQVRALKSFEGRHGFIRAGQVVNLEDGYARDLMKNKLVEPIEGDGGPKPDNRQSMMRAPRPSAPVSGRRPGKEPPLGDGPTLTPLSSRAARAQAGKTPNKSDAGAKKGASSSKGKTATAGGPNQDPSKDGAAS